MTHSGAYRQRSLVEVLLPDSDKLWDPTLRHIDTLLEDDVPTDRIAAALARRHPQSQRRGRHGTPATVVLRMFVLKHLYDWSFEECEREVRGLVYRAFCRIDGERVPDAKTLIRLSHLLDEAWFFYRLVILPSMLPACSRARAPDRRSWRPVGLSPPTLTGPARPGYDCAVPEVISVER